MEKEIRFVVTTAKGVAELDEGGQKIPILDKLTETLILLLSL